MHGVGKGEACALSPRCAPGGSCSDSAPHPASPPTAKEDITETGGSAIPGLYFTVGHVLVMDSEHKTGQRYSDWRDASSFQVHHPSIRHSPSIYACSQDSEIADQDSLGVLSRNLCCSLYLVGTVFLKQLCLPNLLCLMCVRLSSCSPFFGKDFLHHLPQPQVSISIFHLGEALGSDLGEKTPERKAYNKEEINPSALLLGL